VVALAPTRPPDVAEDASESERLQAELLAAFGSNDAGIACRAVRSVAALGMADAQVIAALTRVSEHHDVALAASALAARIELGDAEAIPAARALVESGYYAENVLGLALRNLTRPEYVEVLTQLLGSRSAALRRGAAYALRENEAQEVVPALAAALDDEDREVQYHAVMGMAKRIRLEPGWAAAYEVFLKDPDTYLQRWREWWAENRSAFEQRGGAPGRQRRRVGQSRPLARAGQRLARLPGRADARNNG